MVRLPHCSQGTRKGTRGVLCGYSHTPVRRQVLLDLLETTDFFIRCGHAWRIYRCIDICSMFVYKIQVPHDPAACVHTEYCNSYVYVATPRASGFECESTCSEIMRSASCLFENAIRSASVGELFAPRVRKTLAPSASKRPSTR